LKARKIYETLYGEVAPGLIKSTIAYINFEKRMDNLEKAKALYYKAFREALKTCDPQSITYLTVQYARFLAFNCKDAARACEILNEAT
jgi:hypothetical protein